MKRLWMTVVIAMLSCSTAFAQVGGMSLPTPGIAATSPLGTPGSSAVRRIGRSQPASRSAATELASPGISPMLTDPTGDDGLGYRLLGWRERIEWNIRRHLRREHLRWRRAGD